MEENVEAVEIPPVEVQEPQTSLPEAPENTTAWRHEFVKAAQAIASKGTEHGSLADRLVRVRRAVDWIATNDTNLKFTSPHKAVLRVLLDKMAASSSNTDEAKNLRSSPTVWDTLAFLLARLPLFTLAKLLVTHKFRPTLVQTLSELASHTTPDIVSNTAIGPVLGAIRALVSRLETSDSEADYHEQIGRQYVCGIFSASPTHEICNGILSPLFNICRTAYSSHTSTAISKPEEPWVSTIVSLWNLRAESPADGLTAAQFLASASFPLYGALVEGRPGNPATTESLTRTWTADLEQFLVDAIFVPSRSEFAVFKTLDIPNALADISSSSSDINDSSNRSDSPPDILQSAVHLLLPAALQMSGKKGTISREDYPWISGFFHCFLEPIQRLEEFLAVETLLQVLSPARRHIAFYEAIGVDALQQLASKYALGDDGEPGTWELILDTFHLPDVFIGGQKGKEILTTVLDKIHNCSVRALGTTRKTITSIISLVANGFADAGILQEFMQAWYHYLTLAEKERIDETKKRRSVFFSRDFFRVRFKNTRQLLSFCIWLEAEDDVEPGALLTVLAAVARDLRESFLRGDVDLVEPIGTRLYEVMTSKISTKDATFTQLPSDLQAFRWEIIAATASWTRSHQLWEAAFNDLGQTLESGSLENVITFTAFRTCAVWADANYKDDISKTASQMMRFFISRLTADVLGGRRFVWEADPTDPQRPRRHVYDYMYWKYSERDVLPIWYLDDLFTSYPDNYYDCIDALHQSGSNFVEFVDAVAVAWSDVKPEILESIFPSLAACPEHLESRTLMGWFIPMLIDKLTTRGWGDEDRLNKLCIRVLISIPNQHLTLEYRKQIIQSWQAIDELRKVSYSSEEWAQILPLLVKAVQEKVPHNFKDLVNIADTLSNHAGGVSEERLAAIDQFKLLSRRALEKTIQGRDVKYFQDAADILVDFTGSNKREKYLRIPLVKDLVEVIAGTNNPNKTLVSVAKKASQVLTKLVEYWLALMSKKPKKAVGFMTRWFEGATDFDEDEKHGLNVFFFFPLSLCIEALSVLHKTGGDLPKLDIPSLEELSDRMVEAQIDTGVELKTYLLRYHRTKLSEFSLTKYDAILDSIGHRDHHSTTTFVAAFVDPLSNPERLQFLHSLLVTHIDPNQYQSPVLSALSYLLPLVTNETVVPNPPNTGLPSFNLDAAHLRLCRLLTQATHRDTFITLADLIRTSLHTHPRALSQQAVELTLTSITDTLYPHPDLPIPFEYLCRIVEACLKEHRSCLSGRLHLLMLSMSYLLSLLINGERAAAARAEEDAALTAAVLGETTTASKSVQDDGLLLDGDDKAIVVMTNLTMTAEEKSRRVDQFTNLVRLTCYPTAGAARHLASRKRKRAAIAEAAVNGDEVAGRKDKKKGRKGKGKGVDDSTLELLRYDAGNHIFILLIRYVELMLGSQSQGQEQGQQYGQKERNDVHEQASGGVGEGSRLCAETEGALREGLGSVFEVVKMPTMQLLGASLSNDEWSLVRDMFGEWKRRGGGVRV